MARKKSEYKITKADLRGVYWRHFLYLHALSYERNISHGYLVMIAPVLAKLFPDKKELSKWLTAHTPFYNVTPPLNPLVAGIDLAMTEGGSDPETEIAFKTAVMGPLCGVGDTLFWFTLVPIAYGIGAGLAVQGNWFGPIIAMLIYVPIRWYASWWFLHEGYKRGTDILSIMKGRLEEFRSILESFAMIMVGALIVTFVAITTPIAVPEWGFNLQAILDGLMPKLLPLLGTFMTFGLLRKGVSATKVVVILLVLGFILGWFGILG